jgi:4-hydroxy-3-methylbut-2-en-1-yl diphosphate reductase
MKSFNVPEFYRSPLISRIKDYRKGQDPRRKDTSPTILDFGPVKYYIARHFGFCYGVENAIEIAFRALDENPGRRIFLLSEMIHNPEVNKDLRERGVEFLQDTYGKELISFDTLTSQDIVMIPAFGAPLELLELLEQKGIKTESYNTTCPFVERVWKKSEQIGREGHTIIIHGKYGHEETRSTFSRSAKDSEAVIVIKDMEEAVKLSPYILGLKDQATFNFEFKDKYTPGLKVEKHFNSIGVINQTTMLASETQEIADYFKLVMEQKYGRENIKKHFADTRDTLCYATNENQEATYGLLKSDADLAFVIGGYNSSNTSHLVELCERKFPTYFISSDKEIESKDLINHFDYEKKLQLQSKDYLPLKDQIKIIISSGASCPDSLLEAVIYKINSFLNVTMSTDEVIKNLKTFSVN